MSDIPYWDWMDDLPEEEQKRIAALIKGQESYRKASRDQASYLEPIAPSKEKPLTKLEPIEKPDNSD